MKWCNYDTFGRILMTGYGPDTMTLADFIYHSDAVLLNIQDEVECVTHFVSNGECMVFPKKPSEYHEWDWSTRSWIIPSTAIELIKAKRMSDIELACQSEIYQGFVSSALGSPHMYPAKPQDQANLVASVTASLLPITQPDWSTPFWCVDRDGVWEYRLHTAEQIQRAGIDGKTSILASLGKNAMLQSMIRGCSTIEEVEAVKW